MRLVIVPGCKDSFGEGPDGREIFCKLCRHGCYSARILPGIGTEEHAQVLQALACVGKGLFKEGHGVEMPLGSCFRVQKSQGLVAFLIGKECAKLVESQDAVYLGDQDIDGKAGSHGPCQRVYAHP